MLKNQKKGRLLFFILIATVFIVLQPLQVSLTNAAIGDGSWSSPYSVSQAINTQNNTSKTVQGYVVGQPTATSTVVTSNFPNDYALAIADHPSETNTANMLYVQIPSSFRSAYGLNTNPSLIGKNIKVTGTLTAYFSHAGLKNGIAFEMQGGWEPSPEPDPDAYYTN